MGAAWGGGKAAETARVILGAQRMRISNSERTRDAGSPILVYKSRSPGAPCAAISDVPRPALHGGSPALSAVFTSARSPSKAGSPVVLPDGRVTRRLTSSAQAGFAARG